MTGAIFVSWWIGLIAALLLTLVAVNLLVRVIGTSRELARLAKRTLPAAVGIVNNTAAISEFEKTKQVAKKILTTAQAIDQVAASVRQKVEGLGKLLGGRR